MPGLTTLARLARSAAIACAIASTVLAQTDPSVVDFDIPAQPLNSALVNFSRQSGTQVSASAETLAGKVSAPVSGVLSAQVALSRLLADTGLKVQSADSSSFVIAAVATPPATEKSRTGLQERKKTDAESTVANGSSASRSPAATPTDPPPTDTKKKTGENDESERHARAGGGRESLETVIVTAQKREERAQDTPLSLTVFDREDIERKGLNGMGDYLNSIPGVTMHDLGAGRNSIVMRGISLDPQSEQLITGSSVGIYLGEVPVSGFWGRYGSTDIKLVDIQRIEVLRGPQGTLYGSSSLGGTIRYVPSDPDLTQFNARLEVQEGYTAGANGDDSQLKAVINIPVVDEAFGLRASAYRFDYAPYIDNVAGAHAATFALAAANGVADLARSASNSAPSERSDGARISAMWVPTANMSFDVTYLAQQLRQRGLPEVDLVTQGLYEQSRLDLNPILSGGEGLESEVTLLNLVFNYDLPWGSFTGTSSEMDETYREVRDVHTAGAALARLFLPQEVTGDAKVTTHEARFASEFDGSLDVLAGLFYQSVDRLTGEDTLYGGSQATNPFRRPDLSLFDTDTTFRETAFFGEATYTLNSAFRVTFGGRLFSYERRDTSVGRGALFGPTPRITSLSSDADDHTLKLNFSWTPNRRSMVYANWAEGFRLGRGVTPLPASTCDLDGDGVIDGTSITLEGATALAPDFLDNYELGWKYTGRDGRYGLNAAVYRVDWSDLPLRVTPACRLSVYVNAGKARSQGLELEGTYQFTDSLQFRLGASFVDAELTYAEPASSFRSGQRLPGSARFSGNVSLAYQFPISQHSGFLRGDYNYVGSYYNNPQEAGRRAGGYGNLGVRAGIQTGRVEIDLFVNNLTNSNELTWIDSLLAFEGRAYRLRPRHGGLSVRVTF
jgi:outer membrane receptor protein involved in Fe transport